MQGAKLQIEKTLHFVGCTLEELLPLHSANYLHGSAVFLTEIVFLKKNRNSRG
jgi:hypothetical protein